ncbi:DUF1850 domain-containing protein [Thermanaerosceptrum fracticalcis]|uniref:DUF1850 domain-containing protein n=1 Tax=Thermanaerosceptrum fracticalcis TaxID=1712410 RepID=A0A7G6DZT3_THEFR|nr:DUF1850 domain-containing protein [Thermanaerosceptrum fracticalcis]QNB45337.1 DUF1850 domain-containing protein [Thermanaerosceptrum fracticalcis]
MKNKFYFFLTCALIIWSLSVPQTCLVLSDQLTSEGYFLALVKDKEEFSLAWRHSVELQPWEETFRVNLKNQEFVLVETRFRAYGAGVPNVSPGRYALENGFIVYKNLNQPYTSLPFYLSHYALYHLKIGNQDYNLSLLVPDNTKVSLSLQKLSRGAYFWSALKLYWKKMLA